MVIAAADVIEKQGFDIGRQLYADATDLSEFCFRMTYLKLALRGIPATVRHGNSLSLETFDQAVTPAFLRFVLEHGAAFAAWQAEGPPPARAVTPRPSRRRGPPERCSRLSSSACSTRLSQQVRLTGRATTHLALSRPVFFPLRPVGPAVWRRQPGPPSPAHRMRRWQGWSGCRVQPPSRGVSGDQMMLLPGGPPLH